VLTRRDVLTELPFGNVVVLTRLSGADLLAALENAVSEVEIDAGRFTQVSGMSYAYDPKRPPGSRIVEVEIGGDPLDVARSYRVAANDYMYRGGDGYEALGRGETLIDPAAATLLASMVMDHIKQQREIAPRVEGRITRVD
jgi:2',3'-cyclic-nucleotide 2'-phosphodiesterase (5'-nucleotidase family)